jgi:replication factor C small subunit
MVDESTIWTEKYRPKTFEQIKGQSEIVDRARAFVETRNMPHLMFTGPAGTGKTTLSLIIVKKLFGDSWRNNYLELNASDERGIDVVRQKVKNFARTKALSEVPFKIIFLDEADALTREAQQALRRTMENYTETCRFILSCNFSSKIIEPIQSRCVVFKFRPIEQKEITEIITEIAKNENLKIDDKAAERLFEISEGDCRRIINVLQSIASVKKDITEESIYEIVSMTKPSDIKLILEAAISGNFIKSREKLLETMLKQSLSGLDMIKGIQKEVWNLGIEDKLKIKIIERCGEIEFRLVEGSDEFIQLESLIASLALLR